MKNCIVPYMSSPVFIGDIPMGGAHPIRLQSMTNTDTLDTSSSVAQCIKIIEAGADYVRLTAQGAREASNLENIKKELRKAGFRTPLIADIHFNPEAALIAARLVEKIRINPGNYADKRASFIKVELDQKEYDEELERIHKRLLPLIGVCRQYGTVIRVGVNHGSLSDRIMTRYGNTPEGMAVSAMEFIRIFRAENFHNLVLSMKSSDTAVMVASTKRLVESMSEGGFAYPLHLGVTEAGEGEDGRIRSAAGIGALLAEGIGDTVRVSLSEEPWKEIPVVQEIVSFITGGKGRETEPSGPLSFRERDAAYKPEVLSLEKETFISEDGTTYTGAMTTVTGNILPVMSSREDEKLVIHAHFSVDDPVKLGIDAAALLGRYFIMRQADGLCISNTGKVQGDDLKNLSLSILQATEARITRTRYISCPTCGRTKFDLPSVVREVKAITSHFCGLKIAVMGCVVNGPGEMAGADYGLVGAGSGKVHIYRGNIPVLKNVPVKDAALQLVSLIESDQAKRKSSCFF